MSPSGQDGGGQLRLPTYSATAVSVSYAMIQRKSLSATRADLAEINAGQPGIISFFD